MLLLCAAGEYEQTLFKNTKRATQRSTGNSCVLRGKIKTYSMDSCGFEKSMESIVYTLTNKYLTQPHFKKSRAIPSMPIFSLFYFVSSAECHPHCMEVIRSDVFF